MPLELILVGSIVILKSVLLALIKGLVIIDETLKLKKEI